MSRRVTRSYTDPVDAIWIEVAGRLGLRVVRSDAVYASTDGRGTLALGSRSSLDPDDSTAQMILHELCHALVQGPEAFRVPDWGLDNDGAGDLREERACLRVQCALLVPFGLRVVLGPTTEHRAFYDRLPSAPLSGRGVEAEMARRGRARADRYPFAPLLFDALRHTAEIASTAGPFLPPNHLLSAIEAPPPRHPSVPEFTQGDLGARCEACAWFDGGLCAKANREVRPDDPACLRFEEELDCQQCGACCREAYGAVELDRGDPVLHRRPSYVVEVEGRLTLRRVDDRCAALKVSAGDEAAYGCRIYADRPRTCRDFTRGGPHCLTARRRVGLSW